jgi:hypothetical protein
MVYDAQLMSETSLTIDESDVPDKLYLFQLIAQNADRFKSALNARLSGKGLCTLDIKTYGYEVRISFQMDAAAR